MLEKKKIFIAILNQGDIRVELVYTLLQWVAQGKYEIITDFPGRKPIEDNRNNIVLQFLRSGYDYLMMIDGDIIPPVSYLSLADHLADDEIDIISGICYAYRDGAIIPLVLQYNEKDKDYKMLEINEDAGLVEVDALGTGAIIIKRKVLLKKEMKWPFKNFYNKDGIRNLGLDLSFCKRAKECGYKVWVNTNYRCSHYTPMDLKPLFKAISFLQDTGKVNFTKSLKHKKIPQEDA